MGAVAEPSYRLRKLWLLIGWLLVALVVYLSLAPDRLPIDALSNDDITRRILYKIGHALAYGTLMFWFLQLYPVSQRTIIALSLIGLGLLLEGLQALTPEHTPAFLDALVDALGVMFGWLLGKTPLSRSLEMLDKMLSHVLLHSRMKS
jgi:VanZ family protein